ncbi:MAG TPA: hypothetical protein VL095_02725 [Flavisolibacter sp.]|nr:hypothetical protein [Flavisolibacter sp.]
MKKTLLAKTVKDTFVPKWMFVLLMTIAFTSSFAQQRNGYLGLEAGVYIVEPYDPGVGAHFSGNAEVANDMFLGAEIGVVKFHRLDKAYLPFLARFSMMPALRSGNARLLVVLAPGYGFYDDSYRRGGLYYKSKGGFAFYGGMGAAFKGKRNGYLTVTIGYSTFGFTNAGHKSNIDGVGIRFGGLFR